jgi:hypothetical protein
MGGASHGAEAAASQDPVPFIEGELYGALDLGEVRAALPDNLYWELGVPTKDPEILDKREQEKARRNEEYGRVLAGDANEGEVNAYYDYRQKLSTDYLELADYIKGHFGEKLDQKFNGLLDVAIRLNKARLAQIPADREDALARSREHAKIREQWQREQAEFNAARRGDAKVTRTLRSARGPGVAAAAPRALTQKSFKSEISSSMVVELFSDIESPAGPAAVNVALQRAGNLFDGVSTSAAEIVTETVPLTSSPPSTSALALPPNVGVPYGHRRTVAVERGHGHRVARSRLGRRQVVGVADLEPSRSSSPTRLRP